MTYALRICQSLEDEEKNESAKLSLAAFSCVLLRADFGPILNDRICQNANFNKLKGQLSCTILVE